MTIPIHKGLLNYTVLYPTLIEGVWSAPQVYLSENFNPIFDTNGTLLSVQIKIGIDILVDNDWREYKKNPTPTNTNMELFENFTSQEEILTFLCK